MKTKFLSIIIGFLGIVGLMISCVQDKEFDTPKIKCDEPNIAANTTIAEIKAMATDKLTQITEDLVVEGYVISDDEAGNFYRTLHFQDALANPTQGLQIDVDIQDMYTIYQTGRKIYIKLKGLYLQDYRGTIKLGGTYEKYGKISIGRLSAEQSKNIIFRACAEPQPVNPKITAINDISDNLINTLIKLEDVEVHPENLCQNYAAEGTNTNVKLQDCDGNTIFLRNSGYAQFQGEKLPKGKGSIVAVLGKYGNDYQLIIRSIDDVQMTNLRCDGVDFSCETPKVNATIQQVKNTYKNEKIQITDNLVFDATITANDKSNNFYKLIYVQDETGGVKVKVNQKDLYARGYNVGQKIIISAKDLYIDNVKGELTLGSLYKNNIGGIEISAIYRHLYLQDENKQIEPTSITELTDDNVGNLVQVEAMQFVQTNQKFAVDEGDNSKSPKTRTLISCDGKKTISIVTSTYADFAKETVPEGNGTIVGVLSKYNNNYQLWLRNKADYSKMTNERCDIYAGATLTTVAAIRTLFANGTTQISENKKIKVVITSKSSTKNVHNQTAYAQDDSAGIALRFNTAHNLSLGDEVEIVLQGTTVSQYKGLLQLNISSNNIRNKQAGTLPTPKPITITQALSGSYESELVQIEGVQFKDNSKTYKGNNIVTDCTDELTMYIGNSATFAGESVSSKNGIIIGVMSTYNVPQLYIRDVQDVNFTTDYQNCNGNSGGNNGGETGVFISEVADPKNNYKARFLELYNSSSEDIVLSGWSVRKYTNGATDFGSSVIDLSNVTIKAKSTIVIASNAVEFKTVYGFEADIFSNYVNTNGDDNYELVKDGVVVDVFGVVGEDGTNTNHDYTDGRANRKPTVLKGNATYTFSEWNLWNANGKAGTTKETQNAPDDFTPGTHTTN